MPARDWAWHPPQVGGGQRSVFADNHPLGGAVVGFRVAIVTSAPDRPITPSVALSLPLDAARRVFAERTGCIYHDLGSWPLPRRPGPRVWPRCRNQVRSAAGRNASTSNVALWVGGADRDPIRQGPTCT